MASLFSIAEITEATGGRAENIAAKSISSLSIDSRDLKAGALFVAIKGDRFDGHAFVSKAITNGAAAALVNEARAPDLAGLPLIIVPDALEAMCDIARAARARSPAKIVAVTGSAGKTTTKEAIRTVLSEAGETHASIKSYNNHWGVPLMLANMPESAKYGVFEIGMNHSGEITPLSRLVQPHIALITNIGPAHIGNFAGIEDIARAKGEIFSGLMANGTAILNIDHDQSSILLETAAKAGVGRIVTYGFSQKADANIGTPIYSSGGVSAPVTIGGETYSLDLKVSGAHMLANAVGAICVAEQLGIPPEMSLEALGRFEAPVGRGAVYRFGPESNPLVLIDESYNANPASMVAALEVFAKRRPLSGRKILVLGDMYELGSNAADLHAQMGGSVLASQPDLLFVVGEYMAELGEALTGQTELAGSAKTTEKITDVILNSLDYGDLIMVKGSNGVGLGRLVAAIRNRFEGGG